MFNEFCIISENEISRHGLGHILRGEGVSVVGEYASISEALARDLASDTVVALDCPDSKQQCAMVEEIKLENPACLVVVLAEHFDFESMLRCFQAGANGYIVKTMKALSLITALRLASMGEIVIPSQAISEFGHGQRDFGMFDGADPTIDDAHLSHREKDVLCCLMAGYSNKVIARQLEVAEATVKVHVKAILRKLKVRNRTQAAIWANSHGVAGSGSFVPR